MALTEAQTKEKLSAFGIPADKLAEAVKWVMDGHIASINALREERDGFKADVERYKADAEQLPKVQKELDDMKAKYVDADKYKGLYETEHKSFSDFKNQIESERVTAKKTSAYTALLKKCKVGEKQIPAIIAVSGSAINELKLDKDGSVEGSEDVEKQIAEKWSGFIMTDSQHGAEVDNPPGNDGTGGTKPKSRAAQLAAQYHENQYGKETKGD